ncbi:MAG: DNA alkylation repair protein [Candidatus Cloacimonadaceae bacterium]|nr:DNA alkylation repair protein [Candidatus Cloacimonadaceae bacterium]
MNEIEPKYKALYDRCEKYCFDHENPALTIKNAAFFKEGYDAYGLEEREIKELRNLILNEIGFHVPELAEFGKVLFSTGKYELGSAAIMILKKHRPRFDRSVYEAVKFYLDNYVENWAHCDLLSAKITPVFLELHLADLEDFKTWRESKSKWTRRCVVSTLHYLKNKEEPQVLLDFIKPMMRDTEKVVQQGIGMLLRELWKLHPLPVEDFLYLQKEEASLHLMQIATEKMSKDKKCRFHRESVYKSKPKKPYNKKRYFNKEG